MMKCTKCGIVAGTDAFYSHPKKKGGFMAACKECHKAAVRANRAAKADQYREYDRNRFQTDPRRRERNARYKQTDAGKKSVDKSRKKWMAKNPEKRAAHVILGNAVRDGRIFKPASCFDCGNIGPVDGHHEDYSKPLDVIWVCRPCHKARHMADSE